MYYQAIVAFDTGNVDNNGNPKVKKFKYVVHLAAIPILQETIKNPSKCINTNILGSQNIIDLCFKFLLICFTGFVVKNT